MKYYRKERQERRERNYRGRVVKVEERFVLWFLHPTKGWKKRGTSGWTVVKPPVWRFWR